MKKLGILLDSFSGQSEKTIKEYGCEIIPQITIIDGKVIRDSVDGVAKDYFKSIDEATDVKTSMPAIGLLDEKVQDMFKRYESIIYIPMNKLVSSTFSTGSALANNYDNMYVADTNFAGKSSLYYARKAMRLAEEGKTIPEIVTFIEKSAETSHCFVIPTDLTPVIDSGRLKGVKKFILQKGGLIPRLLLSNEEGWKVLGVRRGYKKAASSSIDKIISMIGPENVDKYVWEVLYSGDETLREYMEHAAAERNIKVSETLWPGVSTVVHTGARAIGINAYKK